MILALLVAAATYGEVCISEAEIKEHAFNGRGFVPYVTRDGDLMIRLEALDGTVRYYVKGLRSKKVMTPAGPLPVKVDMWCHTIEFGA